MRALEETPTGIKESQPTPSRGESIIRRLVTEARTLVAGLRGRSENSSLPPPEPFSVSPISAEKLAPVANPVKKKAEFIAQPSSPPKSSSNRAQRMAEHAAAHPKKLVGNKSKEWKKSPKPADSSFKGLEQVEEKAATASYIESRVPTDKTLTLTPGELLWVTQPEEIRLDLITLKGSENLQFYYADFIRNTELVEAQKIAESKGEKAKRILENLLFAHIRQFIETRRSSPLERARSNRRTFYNGNSKNCRVYFMRFDNIEDKHVIIRVALCDSVTQENIVLDQLSQVRRKK